MEKVVQVSAEMPPMLTNAYDWMHSIEVRVAPIMLLSSSTVGAFKGGVLGVRPVLVVWSLHAAALILRGVRWHDEPHHCRTWAEGCRCDLGDEA